MLGRLADSVNSLNRCRLSAIPDVRPILLGRQLSSTRLIDNRLRRADAFGGRPCREDSRPRILPIRTHCPESGMGSSRIMREDGNEFGVDDAVANALGSVTHCHGHPSHVVGNLEFAYSPLLGVLEDLLADSFFIPNRKDRDSPPFPNPAAPPAGRERPLRHFQEKEGVLPPERLQVDLILGDHDHPATPAQEARNFLEGAHPRSRYLRKPPRLFFVESRLAAPETGRVFVAGISTPLAESSFFS